MLGYYRFAENETINKSTKLFQASGFLMQPLNNRFKSASEIASAKNNFPEGSSRSFLCQVIFV